MLNKRQRKTLVLTLIHKSHAVNGMSGGRISFPWGQREDMHSPSPFFQGEASFDALFGIYLTKRPTICISDEGKPE